MCIGNMYSKTDMKKMHCIPKMINGHIMKYVRVQNIHDCKTPLST